ncbi:cilia- and flagella-associated protein 52 [Bacillus rossius redtenbacheri]|uniref:cilia- and flagella-associated protein 52 n=1 Tax=Bacillus rossius redtenbacheri TaxID=93214 RepID=UPI002FDDCDFB
MAKEIEVEEVENLELLSVIGFDGITPNGLLLHPDMCHLIYPLGSKIVVQNRATKRQEFLCGHTNFITALDISPDGKMIASGQLNHMGFAASVRLWDFEKREEIMKHELHKVRVESLAFSCDSKLLTSLGGRDDSYVIVWDIENNEALCGSLSVTGTSGDATVLCRSSNKPKSFCSAGMNNLRVWTIHPVTRSLSASDVAMGMIRRIVLCLVVDSRDEYLYCGTTTGDIMKVKINYSDGETAKHPVLVGCLAKFVNKKKINTSEPAENFKNGVTALLLLPSSEGGDNIVVGAGDGTVEVVKEVTVSVPSTGLLRNPSEPHLRKVKTTNVGSKVTSLRLCGDSLLVGTELCEMYTVHTDSFQGKLLATCHTNAIFSVTFPHNYPKKFLTSSKNDIRVWETETSRELIRITVQNFSCTCVRLTYDGKSIVSGWNDGSIRAFTPQTGRLIYLIHNAHRRGISALAVTRQGQQHVVTGGCDGQVQVWRISPTSQTQVGVLKQHKAPVSSLHLAHTDTTVVSASTDGTCIIWDIVRLTRLQTLFSNTQFMYACYNPSGTQVITVGSNRKIGYWEVFDGSLVREVEGSTSSSLNCVDVSSDGRLIVTGGNDQIVKMWKYLEGVCTHVGLGHAGIITSVCFSPDDQFVTSVGSDGGIFRWKNPVWKVEEPAAGDAGVSPPAEVSAQEPVEQTAATEPVAAADAGCPELAGPVGDGNLASRDERKSAGSSRCSIKSSSSAKSVAKSDSGKSQAQRCNCKQ